MGYKKLSFYSVKVTKRKEKGKNVFLYPLTPPFLVERIYLKNNMKQYNKKYDKRGKSKRQKRTLIICNFSTKKIDKLINNYNNSNNKTKEKTNKIQII